MTGQNEDLSWGCWGRMDHFRKAMVVFACTGLVTRRTAQTTHGEPSHPQVLDSARPPGSRLSGPSRPREGNVQWALLPATHITPCDLTRGSSVSRSPTSRKAGHPGRLQRPGGQGGCPHSSGGWSTGDGAMAGPWECWGLPGSQAACSQPLRDQKGGSGPSGLGPQPLQGPPSLPITCSPTWWAGNKKHEKVFHLQTGGRLGGRNRDRSVFPRHGNFSLRKSQKRQFCSPLCLLPLILVTGDWVSSWAILATNSSGSHS